MLRIRAEAATTGQTGVEMEAMTAASVAALTVYDMVKGVERGVEIRRGPAGLEDRRQERRVASARPAADVAAPGPPARATARPAGSAESHGRPKRPAGRSRRAGGRAADEAGARPHGQRRVAAGAREDASGAALAARLTALGFAVERGVVADDAAGDRATRSATAPPATR